MSEEALDTELVRLFYSLKDLIEIYLASTRILS